MSTNINSTEQIVEINAGDQITNVNIVSQSTTQVISGEQVVTVDVNAGTIPAAWGSITGTLSNQTDLQNALNAKQNNITLTTTGTSGAATLIGATLNIPNYTDTGLTSVGLAMPEAFTVSGSPLTSNGTITVLAAGTGAQYIKGDGSLGTFPTTIDQSLRLIREVYNNTGATLTKGTIVYINGGQGNLPTVTKALATGDATSAQTFGVVQANITNQNNGYVVVAGGIDNLDTQAFSVGAALYLSPTVAGQWTTTKPYAPDHLVYIGTVVRSHPTQGVVEVRIANGYELDEIHNVSARYPNNNDGLFYNSTSGVWENKTVSGALGYTPVPQSRIITINGTAQDLSADRTYNVGTVTQVAASGGTGISVAGSPVTGSGTITITNTAPDQVVGLTGAGTTSISGTYPNFTITSNDQYTGTVTSVAASGGTGISISGSPITSSGTINITNTAPDQIVSLTGTGTTSVSGTYPSFTINSADQYTGTVTSVAVSGGTGITISGSPVTGSGTINVVNSAPDQIVSLTGAGTTSISGTYPNFTVTSNDQYVGTVTSVNATVPTGFEVSGVPITTSGTVDIKFASGYSLPTNAKQSEWDTAYTKRLDSLTVTGNSGSATLTSNVLNVPTYTLTGLGGEPAITAGTTSQYWRGDKSFQTLDTSVVPENGNVYFTEPRVRATVLSGLNITGGSISASDSVLNAFGKVQNQINGLIGGSIFQSTWNASTNTPSLASGIGTKGYYYIVSVAGTTNLDGITDWQIGDWAIFDGTVWRKVDNTDAVVSVNGYTGVVNLVLDDLADVSAASPTDTQLLRFNGTTSKWYNWTPNYEPALTKGNLTEATSSVLTITGGSNAVIGSGTTIEVKSASASQNGVVTTGTQTFAGAKTFNDNINGSTFNFGVGARTFKSYLYGTDLTTNTTGGWAQSHRIYNTNDTTKTWFFGAVDQTAYIKFGDPAVIDQTGYNGIGFALTSAGAATFNSSVTASSFVKSGGTSSQFLKADGSVDSTSYLPLTGGTLTNTGGDNTPILALVGSSTDGFQWLTRSFNPTLGADKNVGHWFGREASTKNSAGILFHYMSAGSNDNYLSLSIYGANHILKLYGDNSARFAGSITASISALGSAASTFVVSDSGTLKSRTSAQVLSDIGALSTSGGTLTGTLNGTNANFTVNDAGTNTLVNVLTLTHTSTGTPATGLGSGVLFRSERVLNSDILDRAAIYGVAGSDIDDDGDMVFYTLTSTAPNGFTEKARLTSNGILSVGTKVPYTSKNELLYVGDEMDSTSSGAVDRFIGVGAKGGSVAKAGINFYVFNGNYGGRIYTDDALGAIGGLNFDVFNNATPVNAMNIARNGKILVNKIVDDGKQFQVSGTSSFSSTIYGADFQFNVGNRTFSSYGYGTDLTTGATSGGWAQAHRIYNTSDTTKIWFIGVLTYDTFYINFGDPSTVTETGYINPKFKISSAGEGTFTSSVTASSIIKSGGTSSEFLKADGTVDSNTYALNSALSGYLPLVGGTLTGTLTINATNTSAGLAIKNTTPDPDKVWDISPSGNNLQFNESDVAPVLILKAGGGDNVRLYSYASNGFLKTSGSDGTLTVDTTSYLPLGGGTLTGALNGTSATFSGKLTISNSADVYAELTTSAVDADALLGFSNTGDGNSSWGIGRRNTGDFWIANYTGNFLSGTRTIPLSIASTGAATFSSSVSATNMSLTPTASAAFTIQRAGGWASILGTTDLVLESTGTNPLYLNVYSGALTYIGGTLSVIGAATFSSTISLADDFTLNSANPQIKWASGNLRFTSIAGGTDRMVLTSAGAATFSGALNGTSGSFTINDAGTNTLVNVLTISHTTSGTAASGIGSGILFKSERALSGINLDRAAIYGLAGTDVDDDGDMAFYTLTSTAPNGFTEKVRLTSNGVLSVGTSVPYTSKGELFYVGDQQNSSTSSPVDRFIGVGAKGGSSAKAGINFYVFNGNFGGRVYTDDALNTIGGLNFDVFNNSTPINAMNIARNGRVLINTISDNGNQLQVNGSVSMGNLTANTFNFSVGARTFKSYAYGTDLTVGSSGGWAQAHRIYNTNDTANTWFIGVVSGTFYIKCGDPAVIDQTGYNATGLTISTAGAATFASSVTATSFFESSDIRLKSNIQDYKSNDILNISAKIYEKDGKVEVGYLAQDLESVLKSAVSIRENGYLDLSYRQVHTAKIAALEAKIKELEAKLK